MEVIANAHHRAGPVFDVVTRSRQEMVVEAAAGPDSAGPGPMELMLVSLATCAADTMLAVISKMRQEVADLRAVVFAARAEKPPRVWTDIDLDLIVRSGAPVERLERALEITERACPASVMLSGIANLSARLVPVKAVAATETRPLRQRLLRPHQSLEELVVPGEDDSRAGWYAALRDGVAVGTIGVFPEVSPDHPDEDGWWRLRAMTTTESHRGIGLGQMLLDAGVEHIRRHGGTGVWCSARTPAQPFYERSGFRAMSDVYEPADLGPHLRMERSLDPVGS